MYINLRILFRALSITFFRRSFSIRRLFWVALFVAVFAMFWVVVAIGRLLDHVFFPAHRKQRVRAPIFIVAPPRSGTTYLQSLLCLDKDRFAFVKLYHTILPAITYQKIILALAWLDGHTGGHARRWLGWCEQRLFGGWKGLHPMKFDKIEEDEGFFVYTLVSESIYLLFPYVEELYEAGFGDALPPKGRHRLMAFYRSCLRRFLFLFGRHKTLLAKNPQFCGRIESLLEEFPDARIIHLVRHPYESLPSHVSLFHRAWQVHSPEITKDSPEAKAYAQIAVDWYQHAFDTLRELDERRYITIPYDRFVKTPRDVVSEIYEHFGLEMSEAYRNRLDEAVRDARSYRSVHEYSLGEFGLSKTWVSRQLGSLMDVYSLER